MSRVKRLLLWAGLACVFTLRCNAAAYAWGSDGHKIVAYIAADNLNPGARHSVAKLLNTPDQKEAVAQAMAAASILPDTEFRESDPSTTPWHYIDICRQDTREDIAARCAGNCVVSKINEYTERLRTGNYDRWGGSGDLAFLIHFAGDINQPLHAATNDDLGDNCVRIRSSSNVRNLHALWDVTLVDALEDQVDSGYPQPTARILESTYAGDRGKFVWNQNSAADIAWHSTQLARSEVYDALKIPLEPCAPQVRWCEDAPEVTVDIDQSYLNHESQVAGGQLAAAGFELSALLNDIWK